MSLSIRQIVLAASDLEPTVAQLREILGVDVCYRDPEVGKFGLHNALMSIGHETLVQFLEVVSPIEEGTTAGRHLARHGDSGYMLILQTDDLPRDRTRVEQLGVRIVWEAKHEDVCAMHLHPKDIGAAIVSLDQPVPPESWRWAGPEWRRYTNSTGAQRVMSVTIASRDPNAMAKRWETVLGTDAPRQSSDKVCIDIQDGELRFAPGDAELIVGFCLAMPNPKDAIASAIMLGLPVSGNTVTMCGTQFELIAA